jgi:DNA polymerase III subunit epsilon
LGKWLYARTMLPAMDIENATKLLEAHADYRVLRRLCIADDHVFAENVGGEPCGRLAVIDTETTGLRPDLGARIIDLAIATCEYGRESGRLYRVVDRYESLEDPDTPIPPEIVRLTGITDQMVRGQRIDESCVARVLDRVGLVICHNARFDRTFLEARYPAFVGMPFACSLDEVPWDRWNVNSTKLDYLGYRFGLFHEGHRARADVDMLLALLARSAPDGKEGILSLLLASARAPSWRVHAVGLPIENKDYAAARGYRWNDGKFNTLRAWWIETRDEKAERNFLAGIGCKSPKVVRQTARERYRSLAARMESETNGEAGGRPAHHG